MGSPSHLDEARRIVLDKLRGRKAKVYLFGSWRGARRAATRISTSGSCPKSPCPQIYSCGAPGDPHPLDQSFRSTPSFRTLCRSVCGACERSTISTGKSTALWSSDSSTLAEALGEPNEDLANEIYSRLPGYASLTDAWLAGMEKNISS